MKHKVLKPFIREESDVYHKSGSFFTSTSFEEVTELGGLGFIKPNEKASSLQKKAGKKADDDDARKD